ncbi:MAG: Rpp14/Pop5 family protein [Nanoarchaeota archaeon]|nr:Rpp14/Pop5 family protein [Nanoarchaeota archaeon]
MTKTIKMKPLLPSLKEKKRYLVFEVMSESKFDFELVSRSMKKTFNSFLGEIGMAKAGAYIMPEKWNKSKQKGVIRLNHDMLDEIRAALTLVKDFNGVEVLIQSVGVSGILKKAELKFMR